MQTIWPILSITFKEGIRNRVLQGILLIAILLCFAYLAVLPMFAFETGKVMLDLGAASVSLAGLVVVLFLSISMLTRDIHQRSVCIILSRPISRPAYVLGKFAGLALMVLLAVLSIVSMSVIAGIIGITFDFEMTQLRNFSWSQLFITVLFNYLGLLILLAVAFLFTVLTTSEYLSMLITFIVYFIGHSLETVVKVAGIGEDLQLGASHLGALKVLQWVFPNLSAFDYKVYLAYGLTIPPAQAFWTAAYGLLYVALLILMTIAIFNRREIR